ncbi:MAG: type II toxin-antitoxin system RelE/ParE family toxin [Polyangiaceae bacterium]
MIRLLVHPQAAVDIEDAIAWYEQQRDGLGAVFLDELNRSFDLIARLPEQYRCIERNTRRALLRRFPYSVYFTVTDSQEAIVWAVLHQHRHPDTLRDRARPTR